MEKNLFFYTSFFITLLVSKEAAFASLFSHGLPFYVVPSLVQATF